MAGIRDWLQLFRSHTSSLEMTIAALGAALAVGTIWDLNVLLFLLFGWLYHNAGYGHNSVEDFIGGYDRGDPNKAHHPLQRGSIKPMTARYITLGMIAVSFVYGVVISGFNLWAIGVLLTLMVMGFVYNLFNKRMGCKFLPIALAHSLLFPFSFLGAGGTIPIGDLFPNPTLFLPAVVLLGTLYLLFQIAYQIMIEGDLKDIHMSEASLLKRLGVGVKGGRFHTSATARIVSFKIKLLSILVLFSIVHLLGGGVIEYAAVSLMSLLLLFYDRRLMGGRRWDHSACLRDMAIMEVVSTFSLAVVLVPAIGGCLSAIGLMAFNLAFFVIMNRLLWGTFLIPRV